MSLEAARWYEDYQNALEKVEAGQCSPEAIENLGAAVVDKPKPQLGKRTYAQRRIDYLPYLTLARAHLLCGNLELARQYLEKSSSFGVAPAKERQALAAAIKKETRPTPRPTPTPAIDLQAVQERYEKATRAVDAAEQTAAELETLLNSSRELPADSREHWLQLEQDSVSHISLLRAEIQKLRAAGDLLGLADAATQAAAINLEAEKLGRQIRQDIENTRKQPEALQPTQLPTPTPASRPLRPTSTPASPAIPDSLYRAAVAYFSGDYPAVLRHLDSIEAEDTRMRAASFLIRGAARFNIAGMSEKKKRQELINLASGDLAQVRLLAPDMKPDPALFPPPFIALFTRLP